MTGIGLFLIALGYSVVYWGVQAISGNTNQGAFTSYLFPFAK
jgi:hypothetical protein